MVQRNRNLNQSLQKLLLRVGGGSPDVFEDFVGLKKGGPVEQLDPFPILLGIHRTLWHKAGLVCRPVNTQFHSQTWQSYPVFGIKAGIKLITI